MSKKIIGIVGTIGAGKDTAGDYISKKLNIPSFQISSPLKQILLQEGKELTRENLIDLGTRLASEKGEAHLAEYILKRAPEVSIITGMRQLGQLSFLKSATDLILISIDANPEVRFERVKRNSKLGEASTLDAFISKEQAENSPPNVQRLFECMKLAEYQVINEGSLNDLYARLDDIMQEL